MTTTINWRAVLVIAAIMGCRLLGLFMILPILSTQAQHLNGATASLIGMAMGAYGLTQAIFQIPMGALSDRIGRRPVIVIGLLCFAAGSVVAALSTSMWGVIIGRACQGAGAIGSTLLALISDVTPDEKRSRAMAAVGGGIGLSFALAMVLGPLVSAHYQLSGVFWFMFGLACLGVVLLLFIPSLPVAVSDPMAQSTRGGPWRQVLTSRQLLSLDASIAFQHAILTALFIALPLILAHEYQFTGMGQSIFYLVVLIAAFFAMVPGVIVAEKHRALRRSIRYSVAALCVTLLLISGFYQHWFVFVASLFVFFTAFTLLESVLPSSVSKVAPLHAKGVAMGVYSTSQYLGIFLGGSLGGVMHHAFGLQGVLLLCAGLALIWLVITAALRPFTYVSTMMFSLNDTSNPLTNKLIQDLLSMPGVADAAVCSASSLLYVKVDKREADGEALRLRIETSNLGAGHKQCVKGLRGQHDDQST